MADSTKPDLQKKKNQVEMKGRNKEWRKIKKRGKNLN